MLLSIQQSKSKFSTYKNLFTKLSDRKLYWFDYQLYKKQCAKYLYLHFLVSNILWNIAEQFKDMTAKQVFKKRIRNRITLQQVADRYIGKSTNSVKHQQIMYIETNPAAKQVQIDRVNEIIDLIIQERKV